MNIKEISKVLASQGVMHVVITPNGSHGVTASGRIKSFDGLLKALNNEDDADYATRYQKWVSGGRKGSAPKGKGKNHKTWSFIRAVVNGL